MSKKDKVQQPAQLSDFDAAAARPKTASLRPMPMTGPVPVEPIASNVQLTPIVQPLAFVPYSTQKQPLLVYDGTEEVVVEDDAHEAAARQEQFVPVKKQKKVSGTAIFLILSGILLLALLVIGKFVPAVAPYTAILKDGGNVSGYEMAESLIANIKNIINAENIIPAAVVLAGVLTVLTILASLIRILKKGACVFAKIMLAFTFAFALVALIMCLTNSFEIGYGLYAMVGLVFIQTAVAYLVRSK